MANEQNINRVGMGVYVDDGATTLATLRAIRQEMETIARLSGRTPGGSSGAGGSQSRSMWEDELKAREAAEIASIKRIAKARADVARGIDPDEVNILAQQKAQKLEMNRRVNEELKRQEEKNYQEKSQREQRFLDQSTRRQRAAADRIRNYARQFSEGTLDPTNVWNNARSLQSGRLDPAAQGDRLTQIWRRQIAEQRAGWRLFLREQRDFESQAARQAQDSARAFAFRQAAEGRAARAGAFQSINQNRIGRGLQAQLDRDYTMQRQSAIAQARIFRQAGLPVPPSIAGQLMGAGFDPNNLVTGGTSSNAARNRFLNESMSPGTRANAGQYGNVRWPQRTPPYIPPDRPSIIGAQPFANFKQGASSAVGGLRSVLGTDFNLGVAGRITRNILLYEVVSNASYGLVRYISNAITAAKTTVEFGNALRFAAEQAGANSEELRELGDSFLTIGLSRQQGRAAVVEAARFAEGRPQDIGALTQIGADIAAARGLGIERTDELIEQLRRRESKFYKRLFGTTVEAIYEQEAARAVGASTVNAVENPDLFLGLRPSEIKSRADAIGSYVAAMDDEAKENAVLNYILAQSSRFQGEAAERANTLAGRIDKLSAAWLNGQEGLGLFITDLKIVNNLMESLTNTASQMDLLRGPTLGQSRVLSATLTNPNTRNLVNPGFTYQTGSTEADQAAYAYEMVYGRRAKALNAIDNYGPALAIGAGVAGFMGLLGRRDSLIQNQNSTYYRELQSGINRYGYQNIAVADSQARMLAGQQRAGVFGSISAGATRSTLGFTNTLSGLVGLGPVVGQQVQGPLRYGFNPAAVGATAPGFQYQSYVSGRPYISPIDPGLQGRVDRMQAGVGAAGGIVGGAIGAGIGSFIAEKIEAGTIVSAGLTILGGAAGNVVGSLAGDAIGSALGASAVAKGGILAALAPYAGAIAAGTGLAAFGAVAIGGSSYLRDSAEKRMRMEEIRANIYGQELQGQREYARIREFKPTSFMTLDQARGNIADIAERAGLSREATSNRIAFELAQQIDAARDNVSGLRSQVSYYSDPARATAFAPTLATYKKQLDDAEKQLGHLNDLQTKLTGNSQAESNLREFGTNDPEFIKSRQEYRTAAAQRMIKWFEEQRREFDQQQSQISQGLEKLRAVQRDSYQVIGQGAAQMTGEDNPYVRILSDQITLAERMKQQWGFLSDGSREYLENLEQIALNRALTQTQYDTYINVSNLRQQALNERRARDRSLIESGGIDRRNANLLDILSASAGSLNVFQTGRRGFAEIFGGRRASERLGYERRPVDRLRQELGEIQAMFGISGSLLGPGPRTTFDQATGRTFTLDARSANQQSQFLRSQLGIAQLSPEARIQAGGQYADAFFNAIQGYTPQQIRAAGLEDEYVQALKLRQDVANQRVTDSIQKANLDATIQSDLDRQLAEDERFRQQMIAAGRDPREVGRLSDQLVLSRTDNIDPKDLSFTQFQQRQEAIERQAQRELQKEDEARQAVAQTQKFQQSMLEEIAALRKGLIDGDMKVLIKIENDTQARLDAGALEWREKNASFNNYYSRRD